MVHQGISVLGLTLVLATGCAEHLSLVARSPGAGESREMFWPPPRPTSTWLSSATPDATFGDASTRIAEALRDAKYEGARWYPVGLDYAHGFAVVTRLEQIDSKAQPTDKRWSSLYPEASNLLWLERDRAPRLPSPGNYRVLLIAYTDLPSAVSHGAPRWNEETWMDGVQSRPSAIPFQRAAPPGARISVFFYEYVGKGDNEGSFVAVDAEHDGEAHVRGAGLWGLAPHK